WIDPAHFAAAVPSHATSMATIKYSEELGLIRQLAIQLIKLLVDNGSAVGPIKIPRHKAFVEMIYLHLGAISVNLRAVTAIEKHALVAVFGAIEQPVEPLQNSVVSRPLIQSHANV